MSELYETLRDNPQAAVAFVTTEHFNLQTARSATISESNGRTTIFLAMVSAGLVALAFAGQVSTTGPLIFGLVLFPVLFFLGLVTFERVLQSSIEDTLYVQRFNRIRRFSVLAGATAGMVAAAVTGQALWPSAIAGLVVFVVAMPLHQAHQLRARQRKPWPFADAPDGAA